MCENPIIRLKLTRTRGGSSNPPGVDSTRWITDAAGRGLFVLVMALIGAVAGGRWLGLAVSVCFSGSGGLFDLANLLIALALLALLHRATYRYAYDDLRLLGRPVPVTRAVAITSALAASTPLFAL